MNMYIRENKCAKATGPIRHRTNVRLYSQGGKVEVLQKSEL